MDAFSFFTSRKAAAFPNTFKNDWLTSVRSILLRKENLCDHLNHTFSGEGERNFFLFIMIISQYFFLRTLKIEYLYPERNEKKFSNHLEVCIRRITFAPAFEREGRQLT